jgi:maltooligosyltrehalose synthase
MACASTTSTAWPTRAYCRKLRRRVDSLAPGRHLPIYVEKILGAGETLRRDWQWTAPPATSS